MSFSVVSSVARLGCGRISGQYAIPLYTCDRSFHTSPGKYSKNGEPKAVSQSASEDIVEGIQGREEFSPPEDHHIPVESVKQSVQEAAEEASYSHTGNVNLSSVMQSNVPEPFNSTGNNYTHMNMGAGGKHQQRKFLSGQMQTGMHPEQKKGFCTQVTHDKTTQREPEGLEDGDVELFERWRENCIKFQLSDCEKQLEAVKCGDKTMAQVFSEQDMMIRQLVQDYQKRNGVESTGISLADQQGVQKVYPELKMTSLKDVITESSMSVQGIQGTSEENCAHFELWLQNCNRYGLSNCSQQLEQVRSGRKTLSEIFAEQDALIAKIAEEYVVMSKSSSEVSSSGKSSDFESVDRVSSGSVQGSDSDSGSGETGAHVKLSQQQRLKRAVKEYGATVVVFHIGISLISLGSCYLAVTSGIDVIGLLKSLNIEKVNNLLESKLATGAGTFVVAYAVHKVFAPVRIAITLTSAPFIVRYLRRVGFLKPPALKKA